MKRIILALALTGFLSIGCTKGASESSEAPAPSSVSISVGVENIPDLPERIWAENDSVSVFDGSLNRKFTIPDPSAGVFSGTAYPSTKYYVLSPYMPGASFKSGRISAAIPVVQHPSDLSSILYSGIAEGCRTSLKAVCSVLELHFTSSSGVSEIRILSGKGETLAGDVTIGFENGDPVCSDGAEVSSMVSLRAGKGVMESGTCFAAVRPGLLPDGIKVEFHFPDGSVRSTNLGMMGIELLPSAAVLLEPVSVDELPEEEPDDPDADFSSINLEEHGVDLSVLSRSGHPRLFLNSADFENIKAKVAAADANDLLYRFHQQVMIQAVSDVNAGPVAAYNKDKLLSNVRNALKTIFSCSYAYRITGEAKYLAKARTDMVSLLSYPNWGTSDDDFLATSEAALAIAVGYDWLYDELPLNVRKAANSILFNFDILRFNAYECPVENNWNQVCNGGALAAALVTYEKHKKDCGRAIDRAIKSNLKAVKAMYNPNGTGIEGYGYWAYAMAYQMVIIQSLDRAFGTCLDIDRVEGLRKTGQWYLFMDGVVGPFCFSDDADENRQPSFEMVCLSAKLGQWENLVTEIRNLDSGYRYFDRMLPMAVAALCRYPVAAGAQPSPSEKVLAARSRPDAEELSPMILTRLGWTYGESDMYFGFKGAGATNNHSHMDGGSFVFDALGCRWASDIPQGTYSVYSKPIEDMGFSFFSRAQNSYRWEVLQQSSYFHNTLSFKYSTKSIGDGADQKWHVSDQITRVRTDVVAVYDSEEEGYGGTIDLSQHYQDAASSVVRTCMIKDGDYLVKDEIRSLSAHSAPFEWRMMTKADISFENGCAVLSMGGRKMYLSVESSGGVDAAPVWSSEETVSRPSGWLPRDWDSYGDFAGFHVLKYSAEVRSGAVTATFTVRFSKDNH